MAYEKQIWQARERQHQNRKLLVPTGTPNEYDETQVEGTISVEGTPFSVSRMNNLEQGVYDAVLQSELAYSKSIDTDKALAELLMIEDINGKIFSADLNKYYTDFMTMMRSSCGVIDPFYRDKIGSIPIGTSVITVDTQVTAIPSSPSLLLHFDSSFNDSIGGKIPSVSTAILSSDYVKYGAKAGYYDGTKITSFSAISELIFGSGNFTIEFDVTPQLLNTEMMILGKSTASPAVATLSFRVYRATDNTIKLAASNGTAIIEATSPAMTNLGQTYNVKCGRNGNTLYCAVDGVVGSGVAFTGSVVENSTTFTIGRAGDYVTNPFSGFIDELMISRSAMNNSNFTPKTLPFGVDTVAVAGTELSIQDGTNYEDLIVQSVTGNQITFKTPTTKAYTNPSVYRTHAVDNANSAWLVGNVSPPTLNSTTLSGSGIYTVPRGVYWLSVLIVGGGGGAGLRNGDTYGNGGGGGGGGVKQVLIPVVEGQQFSYSVGAKGAPATAGGNTVFGAFTAVGGGKGCTATKLVSAQPGTGGSGGGAANVYQGQVGQGGAAPVGDKVNQGFRGGNASPVNNGATQCWGAGGGGAKNEGKEGLTGVQGVGKGGNGGDGVLINGVYYGAGGYGSHGDSPSGSVANGLGWGGPGSGGYPTGGFGSATAADGTDGTILVRTYTTRNLVSKKVIRMNIAPTEQIREIASFITKSILLGYSAEVFASVVANGNDESYANLVESSKTFTGYEEITAVNVFASAGGRVTLKLVLTKNSVNDATTITKLIGGVSN